MRVRAPPWCILRRSEPHRPRSLFTFQRCPMTDWRDGLAYAGAVIMFGLAILVARVEISRADVYADAIRRKVVLELY